MLFTDQADIDRLVWQELGNLTMANIENLKAFDPFADAAKGDDESVQDGLVHVRIQQRNGRKTLTSVQVSLSVNDNSVLADHNIIRACHLSTT